MTDTEEKGQRRNPQDKSREKYHDERYRCRKCARGSSCFEVHKSTNRIITIERNLTTTITGNSGKNTKKNNNKSNSNSNNSEYEYDDPRYEMKKLLENGHRATVKTYTALIKTLGKRGNAKEAERIFMNEAVKEFDCDAQIYNAVCHAFCENDEPDEAMRFVDHWVEKMNAATKGPNQATHPEIINAYGRKGEYRKVYRTLRIMEERHSVVPSERTYNAFIKGCIENNDPDEAEQVLERWNNEKYDLEKMASKTVTKPVAASYGMVIDWYCSNDEVGKGRKLMEKMRWANVAPSLPVFNMLIKGYLKQGNPRAAEVIFRELQGGGEWDTERMNVKPDVQTYTMFLEYWANSGDVKNVERYINAMKVDKKIEIDSFVVSSVAKAYARHGDPEMAEKKCKAMMEQFNIKPHVIPLTTVVAAYCTTGDTIEAERMVNEMITEYNVNPNERTFSHVIWAHGQREDAIGIKRVASWMIDMGFRIDRGDTNKALTRALQDCGLGRNAIDNVIQDILSSNVLANRRSERVYDRSGASSQDATVDSDSRPTSTTTTTTTTRSYNKNININNYSTNRSSIIASARAKSMTTIRFPRLLAIISARATSASTRFL